MIGLGLWPVAEGWADTVPRHRYTERDGLPAANITALAQTANGLLWIGTQHGLAVYDGHEFRVVSMPDSVRQKQVDALAPMPDGSVWAGVGHDAVRVEPQGPVRTHLLDSHHVVEILRRGDQVKFVTHRAVWTLGVGGEEPARTSFQYETLSNVTFVGGADLDSEGRLWILNPGRGPGRVQTDGTVTFADRSARPGGSSRGDRAFSDLSVSEDGTMLVTKGSRLFRFNLEEKTFDLLAGGLGRSPDLHWQGKTAYLTRGRTLRRYDTEAGRMMRPLEGNPSEPLKKTSTVLRDREGGLWIGTENGLLHVVAPEARQGKMIDGVDIRYGLGFRGQGEFVWGNTWGDGLFQLRPERRSVTPGGRSRWVFPRSHDDALHGLAGDGREWYRWRPAEGWQRIGVARNAVRGYVDSSGVGYFWHNDGLYRHVPDGDTTAATQLRAWPVGESQHHLMGPAPNGDIILFDEGDVLRLRRPDGVVTDTIATVPAHASSGGRRLTIDSDGRIWCPFSSLLRIDPETGATQTLLEGVVVENVRMAADSLAMAKTNEGLYLLDAETGAVRRHLTKSDGLLSNDVNGVILREDSLYVGHSMGYTRLPADSLLASPPRPRAVFTGLEVNFEERPLTAGSRRTADERAIGFSYTGASLTYPDRVHYEVRLVPRDSAWKATQRRFARYTNLEPGTYHFYVRARLGSGAPGPVASYTFTIAPHFYETWWFRLLVGLGIVVLAVGAYRWRTYRLRKRQEELQTAVTERTRELAEEKKKTEQQAEKLAELDEAKNRFFAHISHEFRTPLSLILSPLRDALQKADDEEITLRRDNVDCMTQNAERLRRLIDQLLDLATLEAGRMELDRQPGDLSVLVARCAEAFRSRAEEKEIDLTVEAPDGRVETRFDPEKVETITSNLVGNAVKFTPAGGRVTVRVETSAATEVVEAPEDEAAQGSVRIVVSDTGPGIEPEVRDQIFDRFEQADNSPTRPHEGTGLGLALTSALAELHGGTVDVESTVGEGSTFAVQLPLVPVAASGTGTREHGSVRAEKAGGAVVQGTEGETVFGHQREEEPGEAAATILIVEDNAEMRAYLRKELADRWTVQDAADGEEGWQVVQEERPDLVVSDVMMPNVDGFELCRRIKAEAELRTIPVLLLTARADEEATLEGLESGADDYVAKPFGPEELRRRIENHLAARQHLQDRYRGEVEVETLDAIVDAEERSFVEDVLSAIDEHLDNPDFGVGALAREMAFSRRQLTRRLKETLDTTPGALIKRRRIERAKALLQEGAQTVSEVAYATGYRSPSAFSQSFRREMEQSPSTYREQKGA